MPSGGGFVVVAVVATRRIATTDIAAFAGCGLIRRLGGDGDGDGRATGRAMTALLPWGIRTRVCDIHTRRRVRLEMQVSGGDAPSGSEMRNDRQAEQSKQAKKKKNAARGDPNCVVEFR